MTKHYAVVFDNDDLRPGVLQFCNMASEEEYLNGTGTNVTNDLEYAKQFIVDIQKQYPMINYRVVEVIIKELDK